MTVPADAGLAETLTPLEATQDEVQAPSAMTARGLLGPSRKLRRREALALLLGTGAFLALGGRSVFADEDDDDAGDNDADPGHSEDEAGPSDKPPQSPPAEATPPEPAPVAAPPPASPAPVEAVPGPPATAKSYTVQAGDTMYSIARKHGVSVDAVLWANKLTDPNVIKQGQTLVIPPATGKLHVVKDGDTVDSLAQSYGVSRAGIITVNGLGADAKIAGGQRLLIPVKVNDPAFTPAPLMAASSTEPVPVPPAASPEPTPTNPPNAGTGSPVPPLISTIAPLIQVPGVITPTGAPTVTVTNRKVPKLQTPIPLQPPKSGISQGFASGHTGIDIFSPEGTPIGAAAAGTVKMAEKNPEGFTGYGWIVILDHGEGISTWYAHLGGFNVKAGDKVKAGDRIGTVGMTGRTTGPHLHFELRVSATAVDPRLAL